MAPGYGGAALRIRLLALLTACGGVLALASSAQAAIPSVFGGDVDCEVREEGIRFCGSQTELTTTPTFDGVPIDVNVAFPAAPVSGPDGNYPLVMTFDGYGNPKRGLDAMQFWLDKGYATLGMVMRGFRGSCGTPAARNLEAEECEDGYLHLMDTRYEVRDAQHLAGKLADEGLVAPRRVGATGGSYGGAVSLSLAVLRDRMMLRDGSLVPWESPGGIPMEIAAATPSAPWSDLSNVLLQNGSALDYVGDAAYAGRPGVERFSLMENLHLGCTVGYCAAAGADPSADLRTWRNRLAEGEPYDGDPVVTGMIEELSAYHSAYGIDPSRAPAPMLLSSGFTDDIVPVEEALRFYARTDTLFPNAPLALFVGDFGHDRAQSPKATNDVGGGLKVSWLDHYLKDQGNRPDSGVTAMTQTCPTSEVGAKQFEGTDWASLAPGEVRLISSALATISPGAGDESITTALSPLTEGAACNRVSGADQPGAASYRLPPAPAGGYTLIGSPTVIADFALLNPNSQVDARLLDVAPDGQETLVTRGVWRPRASVLPVRQVFQLQANGWVFEPGHVAKLELIPEDGPFWRPSNDQGIVTVSNLDLRLPVREQPGSRGDFVGEPEPKLVPPGYELARQYEAAVKVRKKGSGSGTVTSVPSGIDCGPTCSEGFAAGTRVTLSATPAASSAFKGWSEPCAGTGSCTLTASATAEIEARFTRQYVLALRPQGAGTISAPGRGISCSSPCDHPFDEDDLVDMVATPAPGWVFVAWSGGGCSGHGRVQGPGGPRPDDHGDLLPDQALAHRRRRGSGHGKVASSPGGITCGTTCTSLFNEDAPITLTATPEAARASPAGRRPSARRRRLHARARRWPHGRRELHPPPHTRGHGRWRGRGCGHAGGSTAPPSMSRRLRPPRFRAALAADPVPASRFAEWEGAPGCEEPPVQLTVDADRDVGACFDPVPPPPSRSRPRGAARAWSATRHRGSSPPSKCEEDVREDRPVTIDAAKPDPDSTFVSWSARRLRGERDVHVHALQH